MDPAPLTAITNLYFPDRRGNTTNWVDGRGLAHRYTYNPLDQVVQEEDPKVEASQPNGYVRQFFEHVRLYDILDRLIEERLDAGRDPMIPASIQPMQLLTRYDYDANENRIRERSPLAVNGSDSNNTIRTVYDERDLVFSITRGEGAPHAATSTYTYDDNGNQISRSDAEDNDSVADRKWRPASMMDTTEFNGLSTVAGMKPFIYTIRTAASFATSFSVPPADKATAPLFC